MDYKHLSTGNIPVYGTGGYMLSVNKALSYDRDAIGIGRKGTIDKPYILRAPFWTVDTLFYAIPQNEECIDFVYDLFQNVDWKKKDESTGVPSLSKVAINNTNVIIPSEAEQRKIGSFTSQLDILLTLHQRKLDQLKTLKKYFLQNMFPAKGEKVPRIRFKGFTGDWEQRKLFDCIEKITDFRDRTPKKLGMDWSNEGFLALSALNVKNGYIDFSQDVHYGDQRLYDKWMAGNELHEGQVLFTTEAPMGNVAQVPDNRSYILSQRTIAFTVKPDVLDENFLAISLRTPRTQDELYALQSGGTAKGVSQKSLSVLNITMPTKLNEQQRIAKTFNDFDHLITLHQHKLDQLRMMKKFMLQNLFI